MMVPVHRRELDLFLKTNLLLANKEFLTRDELRQVFEKEFREARDRMIMVEANNPRRTGYHGASMRVPRNQGGFGNLSSPNRATNANPWTQTRDLDGTLARAPEQTLRQGQTLGQVPHPPHIEPSIEDQRFNPELNASLGPNALNLSATLGAKPSVSNVVTERFKQVLKNKRDDLINAFNKECGPNYPGATLNNTKKVLSAFKEIPQDEVETFFRIYAIGDLFFYRE